VGLELNCDAACKDKRENDRKHTNIPMKEQVTYKYTNIPMKFKIIGLLILTYQIIVCPIQKHMYHIITYSTLALNDSHVLFMIFSSNCFSYPNGKLGRFINVRI
jgi:hypothetical protein